MPRRAQPRKGEPIRDVMLSTGPAYRATVDTSQKGEKRSQRTATFASLAGARAWVAETRHRVAQGEYLPTDGLTLRALADRWLSTRTDVREVTRYGYAVALRPLLDHGPKGARFGDRRVQDITPEEVSAMVAALGQDGGGLRGKGLGHRSIVYGLGTLRQVLSYGVRTGVLRVSPAEHAKPPRQRTGDRREVATWTPAELREFVTATDGDEWAHGWRLAACGLRRSEALGLRWRDVDRDSGAVTIRQGRVAVGTRSAVDDPKSGQSRRTVPAESIWPGTRAALSAAWLASADKSPDGFVITDAAGRAPLPERFSDRFRDVSTAAGLPAIRLHSLRHSLAMTMHRRGVAPRDAAALLGHSVQVHLSTYLPGDASGAASAAAALGQALAGPSAAEA